MNKIFKVVWSKVKHCYVVVSEIAKNTTSGGARRCRMGKVSLAAAMAAAVLTGSFAMPNGVWAATVYGKSTLEHYVAFTDTPPSNIAAHYEYRAIPVTDNAGNPVYEKNDKDQMVPVTKNYYVLKGYDIIVRNQERVVDSATPVYEDLIVEVLVKDASKIPTALKDLTLISAQSIVSPIVDNETNNKVMTVLGTSLNSIGMSTYVAAANGGSLADVTWDYIIEDTNGKWVNVKGTDQIVPVTYNSTEGRFYYETKDAASNTVRHAVANEENIYYLTDTKDDVTSAYVFLRSDDSLYTGTVRGLTNEILMTAVKNEDGDKVLYTYWGGKLNDDQTLVSESDITVGDLNKAFRTFESNDKNLAQADIVNINLTRQTNGNGGTLGLIRNNDDSVLGEVTITSTGGIKNQDVKVQFTNYGIKLDENGNYVTDTTQITTFTVDAGSKVEANKGGGEKLSTISINGTPYTIQDNDTKYTVSSVAGTGNVKNTYTVSEVAGSDVGVIEDTDTRILSGEVVDSDPYDGSYNIKLQTNEPNGNGDNGNKTIDIKNLHDYYTTGATYDKDAKIATFTRLDGKTYTLNLAEITSGLGTMSSWTAKVGEEDIVVDNGAVLEIAKGNDNIVINAVPDGKKITVATADEVTFDKVTVGSNVIVDDSGIVIINGNNNLSFTKTEVSVGGNKITNVANGRVEPDSKDAINGGQLNAVKTELTNNDKYLVTNPDSTAEDGEYTVVKNKVTLKVKNGEDVVINGIASKTELVELAEKVNNVTAEASKKTTVSTPENGNLKVTSTTNDFGGTDYNVDLKNDITLTTKDTNDNNKVAGQVEIKSSNSTVTVGTDDAKKVSIDGAKGVITAGNKITLDGTDGDATFGNVSIDGANGSIKAGNVTVNTDNAGTINGLKNTEWGGNYQYVSGQAATEDQLHKAVTTINTNINAAKTEVNGGENIKVASASGSNGQTIYTVSGTDSIKAGKVDVASDGSITLEHVNAEGEVNGVSTRIEGLHDYVIDEQTQKVTDGEVTLKVTDKYNSKNTYDVKITDVASASKLEKVEDKVDSNTEKITEHEDHINNLYGNDKILSQNIDSRINHLGSKVNKVGAGAAALAALHPMDFDPDDKLSFSAGVGNYAGQTATALGAFYRPNEKVMMSIGGTYGNNENMVNMGVSFALDRTNNISNSRTAMAREIVDLREQVATQGQQIAQLVALVNQLAGVKEPVAPTVQPFPDVPANHWAYEYLNNLVAMGVIEGYPDGTFGGDRTMTRYEFATMLFKAMQNGAVLSEQIRQEFNAELGRIRVDRIKGADDDANKIERVRVNNYEDRDDYGSKIVMVSAGK